MNKGVKFRIYPNKEQKVLINKTFGCCRLVYNKGLAMRNEAYKNGHPIGYSQTSAELTKLKSMPEYSFLKEVDSMAPQQSLRDLDKGFSNFFKKLSAHPVYKSKHDHNQSYRTLNQGQIYIAGRYIKLPKLGYVKIRQSMDVGHINNVTVERTASNKYYAVLNVDFEPESMPNKGGIIGIDMGIKRFYTDDHGNTVDNPKYLERSEYKLTREQHRLSRKVKGSHNYEKQRIRVARAYEKISNQRNDFLQKESTKLVRENQTIYVEDLGIKNLLRNHKLAKHISSVSWSNFIRMLEYKGFWYGTEVVRVPRNYASSQICHVCGHKNPAVKDLRIRKWVCPECNTSHDRDYNAAINIFNKGQLMPLRSA